MRFNVGAKFVAAKKCVASEERIAFALEIIIVRQPGDLITMLLHPARKMRRFIGAFFVTKIARDEFFPDCETGVRRKNHVGKFRLRRDQLDLAIQFRQGRVQIFPLLLRQRRFRAARAAHPWIDFVLDAVMVRRTEKQLAHKIDNLLANHFGVTFGDARSSSPHRDSKDSQSARAGTLRCP